MAEYPILFNGEMVRAVLDGRKTQTRRVIKPKANEKWLDWITDKNGNRLYDSNGNKRLLISSENGKEISCPYGAPGNLLWVRETWAGDDMCGVVYRADHPNADISKGDLDDGEQQLRFWRPSIHMPRWASRITLRVTDVRVERVQEISHDDATAEGLTQWTHESSGTIHYGITHADVWEKDPRQTFQRLWDSINAARGHGWDVNPWVWVVSFERVTP